MQCMQAPRCYMRVEIHPTCLTGLGEAHSGVCGENSDGNTTGFTTKLHREPLKDWEG